MSAEYSKGRRNKPDGFCGRKAPCLLTEDAVQSSGAVCESGGGRPGLPVSNSPYGLCGRKATLNFKTRVVLNTRKMCKCFRFLASCLASISVYAAKLFGF